MKLVVGLGNPGRRYQNTRHNIGWEVLAALSQQYSGTSPKQKFSGEVVEIRVAGEMLLLLAPHTYMNRSGQSVRQAVDFYRLEPADLLVICDDMNLPIDRIRIRAKGSAGGQKGLADILRHLSTEEVPRLRLGVGRPPEGWNPANYVLGQFSKDERPTINASVDRAVKAVACWAEEEMQACMNRFNAPVQS
ncbi:Peptidyl-tRNA hydrolase [Planctomycetales bacterium 10988]|nr:Peptidyl-tRNA hydrolase [Planctomycetales bacterium 10988]